MTQELKDLIHARAQAVQERYHRQGRVFQVVWLVAAFVVIAVGVALLVLPGPGILVLSIGVAMLAARFRWAQALLRATIEHGVAFQRRVAKASPAVKVASTLVGVAAVAAVALLMLR